MILSPYPDPRRLGWLGGLCLLGCCLAGLAQAADAAWTLDRVSTGLQALGRPVAVAYAPAPGTLVPPTARITQVYAARDYAGRALVRTDLCWGSAQGPCVPLQGGHLNTRAFNGKPAGGPLLLVHRVEHWVTDHPPLFVRGTVTVWYADSPAAQAR
ncbi:hypothetical protein ACMHYJ_02700 [Castellaniella hirudinis]|uniref:hypothetical protein n=1 Tax=Castellaniella hirudinis TaxID=1144617 RepID=UPI0039C29650